ncbi:MAG: hypothetical protein FJX65_06635 [Alphaproteobacteria bacterium]|nr:hypothetical protein [Alphaproteobacteria bacterium]
MGSRHAAAAGRRPAREDLPPHLRQTRDDRWTANRPRAPRSARHRLGACSRGTVANATRRLRVLGFERCAGR